MSSAKQTKWRKSETVAKHARPDDTGDLTDEILSLSGEDDEDEPNTNPWVAGLIAGVMVALVVVITLVILLRMWLS